MDILALLLYTKTLTKGDSTGNFYTSQRLGNVYLRIRVICQCGDNLR